MTSKFELSISTDYVPDWGIVEAFRELFQNALDNQTMNPDNIMSWEYDKEKQEVVISNKTSKLNTSSLLLGNGTKHDRTDTIGKHGEGYKIAFMVLLRNKKSITVENYGANEIWDVRLVKSRKYKGELVPTVFVNKEPVWKKKPNNDLTIIVDGVTEEEYEELVRKNLNLRDDVKCLVSSFYGRALTGAEESGNIYVNGLFIAHKDGFEYGYDFKPSLLSLDRDRKLVDSFDIKWYASSMWADLSEKDSDACGIATKMVMVEANDVAYIESKSMALSNSVADKFLEDNGNDAIPVTSNCEYNTVMENNAGKPIIVSSLVSDVLKHSSLSKAVKLSQHVTVKDMLNTFKDKIADRLSDDELSEFEEIIAKVNN